jgi:protein phosphatase
MDIGSFTDVGHVREGNEDALLVVEPHGRRDGPVIVAVADGMGGHNAGEVASAIAIDVLRQVVEEAEPTLDADVLLTSGVELGNEAIWQAAAEDIARDGMGTTLVCAFVDETGRVVIANVGDSRAYAYLDGTARLVTADHTWVQEQVLAGYLTPSEARTSPYRNLLTRTLGNAPRVDVDLYTEVHLAEGDGLVLVSDGVTGYLDESDFDSVLREADSAQAAAERLVSVALERGGADNATAVVVRRKAEDTRDR